MTDPALDRNIAGLAVLQDPVRRALYFHVQRQGADVSREDAAAAVGVSRNLAAFHLDRLAEEGLLEVSFRRLTGRAGPGAGRPSKLYRPSGKELSASVPPRSYGLAAQLLAAAIDRSGGTATKGALRDAAHAAGVALGEAARDQAGPRAGSRRLNAALLDVLAANGYAPERAQGEIRLRNCPFHALVAEHRELVCGMNLGLMEGVIEGAEVTNAEATLLPRPGLCCVSLRLRERR